MGRLMRMACARALGAVQRASEAAEAAIARDPEPYSPGRGDGPAEERFRPVAKALRQAASIMFFAAIRSFAQNSTEDLEQCEIARRLNVANAAAARVEEAIAELRIFIIRPVVSRADRRQVRHVMQRMREEFGWAAFAKAHRQAVLSATSRNRTPTSFSWVDGEMLLRATPGETPRENE